MERGRWEMKQVWRDMEKNKGRASDGEVPTGACLLLTMAPAGSWGHREGSDSHTGCVLCFMNALSVRAHREDGRKKVNRGRQGIWTLGWPLRNEWA